LIENSFTISFCKDFWSSGESHFEANLVFLAAGATVHRFARRLDQVGVHLLLFQLHGFTSIFIALFILKHEALSRPN
jgi:hypothetical protein